MSSDKKLSLVPPAPPQLTPLEFLMRFVNNPDPGIDDLRVQAAIALLPYCHEAKPPLCTHTDDNDE